jgi:hypothetical protein
MRNDFYGLSANDREVIGDRQISRKKKFVGEAIEALPRAGRAERRPLPHHLRLEPTTTEFPRLTCMISGQRNL